MSRPHPRPTNSEAQGRSPDISEFAGLSGDCKVQLSLRTYGIWISLPTDVVQVKPAAPETRQLLRLDVSTSLSRLVRQATRAHPSPMCSHMTAQSDSWARETRRATGTERRHHFSRLFCGPVSRCDEPKRRLKGASWEKRSPQPVGQTLRASTEVQSKA